MDSYEKCRREEKKRFRKITFIAIPVSLVITFMLLISPAALGGIVYDAYACSPPCMSITPPIKGNVIKLEAN